ARPYDANEPLQYALQSFPMLVKPGGKLGFPDEDGQPSRRTVIAQDRDGRFLFIIAPWGKFTLHQLSAFLVNSDLDLDIALNLDGGSSSGLLWADNQGVQAMTAVPAVIAVYGE
ncbi:MAG: phosphodiester glycosidase family protein, partial [Anaerolineae bacterium]